jgi:hypothetical protein
MRRLALFTLLLATTTFASTRALELRDGGGRETFTVKWEPRGAKLVDPAARELARFEPKDADRLKIKDAADAFLGEVTGDAQKLSVKNAEKNVVFVLRRQGDGDYKLEDGHDGLLAKLERKGPDYVRGEDAAGKTLFKAKSKHGKLVLTNAAETTILTTAGTASLMGFAVFGLDRLTPPQRAALFYRLDTLAVP